MTATAVAREQGITKGGCVAPLFFLSLALAAYGSRHGLVVVWASAALAMAAAGFAANRIKVHGSWLMAFLVAYVVLVASSTLFLGPVYSPAGLYHPLLLLAGFLVARVLDDKSERAAVLAGLAFAAIIALWGMAQVGLRLEARAHALLETPATLAAVLNLTLAPILAVMLAGSWRWPLALGALVLAIGLFAADSRGGLVALSAGCGLALILGIRAGRFQWRSFVAVLVLLAAGWSGALALRALPSASMQPPAPSAEARAGSTVSRMELYALSLAASQEKPVSGTGYLTYRYTLEQGRARVPSYGSGNETWFVHNDYLQTLQELGPAGLLAFAGFTLLPPILAYRSLPTLPAGSRLGVVAAAAGLGTMAVHALVDFPFYVPLCLLLYAALLGVLDRRLQGAPVMPAARAIAPWYRIARTGFFALAAIVLLRPVAAEAASAWGLRALAAGKGQVAAFWLGAAQRIESQDWRYHWQAGQFWDFQASESGKREAAQLSVDAYLAGYAANPLEVRNLLGLIAVHRRHRELLASPADDARLRAWAAQAVELAPLHPGVRELTLR